jgi:hypothetical protein
MQDRQIFHLLTTAIVVALLFTAGCSSTRTDAVPASPVSSPAQGQAEPAQPQGGEVSGGNLSQLVVKNSGTTEIHVWISDTRTAWEGNSGNRLGPGNSISLSILPDVPSGADSPSGTAQHFVCIGRSETVLMCREITPATIPVSGTLIWDGTGLNAET